MVWFVLAFSGVLVNPEGKTIGHVEITPTSHGVILSMEAHLPPGTHALHLHEKGSCEAPDFKSAGGHYNPGGSEHGWLNPQGFHAGDFPNIHVVADTFAVEIFIPWLSEKDFQEPRAIVIHEKADDYRSQPAGAAGKRIACAVIR